jgi:hypothetical protein
MLPIPGQAARSAALRLGDRLDQLNMARAQMARRRVDPMTAGGAAWLMNLAQMDRRRRILRRALASALGECARLA